MLSKLGLFIVASLLIAGAAYAQSGITPCASATISVSGTSANSQLSACGSTLILWNVGSTEAFYRLGSSSGTTAVTTDNSIPASAFVVLNVGSRQPYLAAITASSTTTLRITQGQTR